MLPISDNPVFATLRTTGLAIVFALTLAGAPGDASAQSSVRPPENAEQAETLPSEGGFVPGGALGNKSDADIWRAIRHGERGFVTIPDGNAAVLIQSDGQSWRMFRNGAYFAYLGWAMLATLALLAVFFLLRGRIRIDHGWSGKRILRFNTIERASHWLMAVSFIILAVSGLSISFGRTLVIPVIGKEAFGPIAAFLKVSHNYVAFAFMLGLAATFVIWVVHNFPNRHDLIWLAKGGGLFTTGTHPPARKFNGGQKILFWLVIIGGASISLSGWALLFPFEYAFFTDTFVWLQAIGIDLASWLGIAEPPYSAIQEQQFNTIWHAGVAVFLICVIFGHIYIGTIGMEGAFDAMGSGEVDLNWAKQHHSVWVDEVRSESKAKTGRARAQPAE